MENVCNRKGNGLSKNVNFVREAEKKGKENIINKLIQNVILTVRRQKTNINNIECNKCDNFLEDCAQ